MRGESDAGGYLLPDRSLASQPFIRVLLWLRLVDLDHSAVEFRLVHVVYGFSCVFREREFDVAEASVWIVI